MVSDKLKNATEVRRKKVIDNDERTRDRDKAADLIEEMWPASLSEIAEESEYSRQHIANTLEYYFEPGDTVADATIDVPIQDIDTDTLTLQFTVNIHLNDEDGEP